MDNLEEIQKATNTKSFVDHVFEFDDETKNELMNICQYSVLAVIPVIGLNKLLKHYVPDVDEEKGSLEIVLEVIGQMILLFIGLFYIHRLVTFLPTYSKQEYVTFNVHAIILVTILIVSSLHTRLGEKTSILAERVSDLWHGESKLNEQKEKSNKPPIQSTMSNPHMPPHQGPPPQQMALGPPPPQVQQVNMPHQVQNQDPMGAFGQNDIMAANEVLGSGFGSMF
jgi:hypothetical protein